MCTLINTAKPEAPKQNFGYKVTNRRRSVNHGYHWKKGLNVARQGKFEDVMAQYAAQWKGPTWKGIGSGYFHIMPTLIQARALRERLQYGGNPYIDTIDEFRIIQVTFNSKNAIVGEHACAAYECINEEPAILAKRCRWNGKYVK